MKEQKSICQSLSATRSSEWHIYHTEVIKYRFLERALVVVQMGIWVRVKSLWRGKKGAEILGLMLESRRFMRPTACAFQPQASAGETKRCGLCVANY